MIAYAEEPTAAGASARLIRKAALRTKAIAEFEEEPYHGDVVHVPERTNRSTRRERRRARRELEEERRTRLREDVVTEIVCRAGLLDKDFVEKNRGAVVETVRSNAKIALDAAGGWCGLNPAGKAGILLDVASDAAEYDRSLAEDGLRPDEEHEDAVRTRLNAGFDELAEEVRNRVVETLKNEKKAAVLNEESARARKATRRRPMSRRMRTIHTEFEDMVLWNAKRGAENLEEDPDRALELARANSVLQWGVLEAVAAIRGLPSARDDAVLLEKFKAASTE